MPLQKRGKIYYYRKGIPAAIRPLIDYPDTGKTEIIISLKTDSIREARDKERDAEEHFQAIFDKAFAKLGKPVTSGVHFRTTLSARSGIITAPDPRNTPIIIEEESVQIIHESNRLGIEKVFEAYAQYGKKEGGSLPDVTKRNFHSSLNKFIEINGLTPKTDVTKIRKSHVLAYCDYLEKTPGRQGKMLDPSTINFRLAAIKATLSYAVKKGYMDTNAAIGVSVNTSTKKKRLPYSNDDLAKIFSDKMFSDEKWTYKQWVPYIALYTGMRLEEISGLLITDVKKDNDIWYFDITTLDEDGNEVKLVKNESSVRKVPIPKKLQDMGILNLTMNEQYLIPDILPISHGRFGYKVSAWWQTKREDFGIANKMKVFHSFRHNMKDALREACPNNNELINAILGHTTPGQGPHYGDGFSLAMRNEVINKVAYEAIEKLHR